MSMFSTPTAPIQPGWKAREAAARAKREANVVSPEVRAARAAILEARDATREAMLDAERQAKTRPLESFRTALASIPDDALSELARYVGLLNPREMADVAGEAVNARARERMMARPVAHETPPTPAVAAAPEKPAGESVRRRGRPPGIRAA